MRSLYSLVVALLKTESVDERMLKIIQRLTHGIHSVPKNSWLISGRSAYLPAVSVSLV